MKQSIAIFAAFGALSSLAVAQFHHHNHGHGHLHQKRDIVYETQIETETDIVQTTIYVPAGGSQAAPPTPAAQVKAADYKAPADSSNKQEDTGKEQDTNPQPPPAQPEGSEQQQTPEQIQQKAIDRQQELNEQQEQKNQQQVQENNQHQQSPQQPPPPPPPPQQAAANHAAPPPYSPPSGGSAGSDNSSGGGGGGGASKTSTVSFYQPAGGTTSCGQPCANSDPGVALGFSIMGGSSSPLCGKSISVKVNGQSHSIPIIDSCQVCDSANRIDLTEGSFKQLFGSTAAGIKNDIEWSMPS